MLETTPQAKFVFICAGLKKGKCFPKEGSKEVWEHLKKYKNREGYTRDIYETACLGVCKEGQGPCLLVLDKNSKKNAPPHCLGAQSSVEEAKKLLDSFMDDYVIDTTPPAEVSK